MYRNRKTTKKYKPTESRKKIESGRKPCPFCQNIADTALEATKYNYVVENIYAYQYWEFLNVTEHLMIVPKRHIKSLGDLSDDEKVDTINLMAKYENNGFNVYARQELNVMKSVPHQHTHLIKTDNRRAKLFLYLKRPYLVLKV